MQSISENAITQGIHGKWHAVDISPKPDPIAYAPEDVTFVFFAKANGDCGNALTVRGASGEHGFCHLEGEPFIKSGQTVKRGFSLFKMGYTGKTIPAGEAGRHAHWILRHMGEWVYPPDLINERFKKGEEKPMPNEGDVHNAYLQANGRKATPEEVKVYTNKPWNVKDGLYYGKVLIDLENAKKASAGNFTPVTEQLFKKG